MLKKKYKAFDKKTIKHRNINASAKIIALMSALLVLGTNVIFGAEFFVGGRDRAKEISYTIEDEINVSLDMSDENGARIYENVPDLADGMKTNEDPNKFTFGVFEIVAGVNKYVTLARSYDDNDENIYIQLRDKSTHAIIEDLTISNTGEFSFADASLANRKFTLESNMSNGVSKKNLNFDGGNLIYRLSKTNPELVNEAIYTKVNFSIPTYTDQTTYYMVVNPTNTTYLSNKFDVDIQNYVPDGSEKLLASFTQTALEGQNYTASGAREFEGYKLYQAVKDTDGIVSHSYPIGFRFMNTSSTQWKRIVEVVGPNNTAVIHVYMLDPEATNPDTRNNLNTEGYEEALVTVPLLAGGWNSTPFEERNIFTTSNGVQIWFRPTNNIERSIENSTFTVTLVNGTIPGYVGGNMRLQNPLAKTDDSIYYYVKQGRVLVNYIDANTGRAIFGQAMATPDGSAVKEISNPELTGYGASVINQDWIVPDGLTYDTQNDKPAYIRTPDNKLYKLVTVAGRTLDNRFEYNEDAVVSGENYVQASGNMRAETLFVAYAYEEVIESPTPATPSVPSEPTPTMPSVPLEPTPATPSMPPEPTPATPSVPSEPTPVTPSVPIGPNTNIPNRPTFPSGRIPGSNTPVVSREVVPNTSTVQRESETEIDTDRKTVDETKQSDRIEMQTKRNIVPKTSDDGFLKYLLLGVGCLFIFTGLVKRKNNI